MKSYTILYSSDEHFKEAIQENLESLKVNEVLFGTTHRRIANEKDLVRLGALPEKREYELEEIFMALQCWNPDDKIRKIQNNGVHHTSMSVGDIVWIIDENGQSSMHIVSGVGFKELADV